MKLLIIDDDENTLDDLKSSLEPLDYECYTEQSAKIALKRYKKNRYDVVITDLRMSGMTGLEFLKALKKIDKKAVVLVITGYPSLDYILETIKNKGYAFLKKPIDFKQLLKILKEIQMKNYK